MAGDASASAMNCHLERITVHYEAFGEGRLLFVLPGWPDPWQVPADYLEPLFVGRRGWRRIYLDLPGRGATRGEPWIESNDDVLAVVLDVIDRLAPNDGYALAGHSAGAYLARAVLRRRFERVDALLQVVPVIRVTEAPEALPSHVTLVADDGFVARLADEFGPDLARAFASRVVVQSPAMYERFHVLVPSMRRHDEAFLKRLALREELSFEVDAPGEPFPRPALFIVGRQDAVVGYRSAIELVEAYPRGTFAVVDGAGHALPWEQPELFEALVREWLDRVEREAR